MAFKFRFMFCRPMSRWAGPNATSSRPLPEELATLGKAMTHNYKGTSVNAFIQYLERNNIAFNAHERPYYGKFCSITQSSGVGKTRLLFELGKKDICVLYMNIRSEEDVGYPLRDAIPANILTKIGLTEDEYRLQCRTFFATVFKCLATFLQKESNPFGVLSNADDERRTELLKDVGREFGDVKQETLCSSPSRRDAVMKKYLTAMLSAGRLSRNNENWPKVVIALDEAHVLHEKSWDRKYLMETVLLQTIKEFSGNEAVWVVFTSTMPKVAHYASLQAQFPLARVEEELLFPPFTQLGWDQYAPAHKEIELDKVAWGSHLLRYGRPLWWSQKDFQSVGDIMTLAAQKLCASTTFNPTDERQAFAVLAQRFGLDMAFGSNRDAIQYNDTFIANHLRICVKTTDNQMWSYTTYPSEPILSATAAELLYETESNLAVALNGLSGMVNDGLINIGDAGELASRFLWLLAKDLCARQSIGLKSSPPSVSGMVRDDFEVPYCQPVPVVNFLELLFGSKVWQNAPNARKVFQDAYINFSHWVRMGFDITRGEGGQNDVSIKKWTESLWARTSAIQCCHNQPLIDKVIPMYFKSRSGETAMSHILISDKARDTTESNYLNKITRNHESIAPGYRGPPYIAIRADLGVQSSDLIVHDNSSKRKDPCLRIYAAGLNQTTYPFLKENIARILNDLYDRQSLPSGPKFLEDLKARMQFGLSREQRYLNKK